MDVSDSTMNLDVESNDYQTKLKNQDKNIDFKIHYTDTQNPDLLNGNQPSEDLNTDKNDKNDKIDKIDKIDKFNQNNQTELESKTLIKHENGSKFIDSNESNHKLNKTNELISQSNIVKSTDGQNNHKHVESTPTKISSNLTSKTVSTSPSKAIKHSLNGSSTKSSSNLNSSSKTPKKKKTSNVRIQCKLDQYLASKLNTIRKELSLSYRIPRVPLPSSDLSHLKYSRFYRTEEHSNGGGLVLSLYWDEILVLNEVDRNELALEFLKESFREEPVGVAKYCISIVHNGAIHMPDFLDYLADTQPTLTVKSGIIGHSGSDIETTTMSAYRNSVEKTYCQGTFRAGPLHQLR